jgi:hypothetical protein
MTRPRSRRQRLVALVGYQLATLARSQRWVGPLVTYLAFLGFVYASEAGPAVIAYGVTAYALFVVVAWLTSATLSAENEVARQVTAAAARGQLRVQVAALVAAGCGAAGGCVVAVGWARVANAPNTQGAKAIIGGLALHAVFALLGLGVGALLGRPLVAAPGAAALGILAVAMLALIVPGSPVQGCLRVLEHNPEHGFAGQLAPSVVELLVVSVVAVGYALSRTPGRS